MPSHSRKPPPPASTLPPLKTRAAVYPDPEHARTLGIAADLRAHMPVESILRKWRTSSLRVEQLRQEMNDGGYGGWTRS
jgi:hypothetical protein